MKYAIMLEAISKDTLDSLCSIRYTDSPDRLHLERWVEQGLPLNSRASMRLAQNYPDALIVAKVVPI